MVLYRLASVDFAQFEAPTFVMWVELYGRRLWPCILPY
jgi:hypothetical protein